MVVLALDLATTTGFALGRAGEKPTSWTERLKDVDDEPERGFKRLGIKLRDLFAASMPDLVAVEAPLNIGGMIELDEGSERGFKFKSNPNTIYFLCGLVASAYAICGPYGIRCQKANVQTVRKHFLGVARPPDPKREVVARCHQLNWLPRDSREHNRADAIALHSYASGHWCSPVAQQLARGGAAA